MRIVILVLRLGFLSGLAGISALSIGAFLGFAHPLLDLLNHLQPILFSATLMALVLSFLLFRGHRWRAFVIALASTGFLASAVIVIPEWTGAQLARPTPPEGVQTIKLMSHNLFGVNSQMDLVAREIEVQNPDIIAFQEYFDGQAGRLHNLIAQDYPFFFRCRGGRRAFVAIYAKRPFELTGGTSCPANVSPYSDGLGRIAAGFNFGDGQVFTVMTTQLNWPVQVSPLFNSALGWPERIAAASARQAGERAELARAVRRESNPVILVGDFNSTPWSYALRRFAFAAGLTRQTRNMFTYPARFYFGSWVPTQPFLPIDHMMSSKDISVFRVKTGEPAGSDHLPIIAEFAVKTEN